LFEVDPLLYFCPNFVQGGSKKSKLLILAVNEGALKLQELTMQEWTMTEENATGGQ